MSVAGVTSYTMDPTNTITEMRHGGRFDQQIILKYQDDTEWIFLNNRGQERFCGFLYLEKAINDVGLKTIKAAENKIAIHDRQIIYLSRYCGEEKPGFMEFYKELLTLDQEIGFTDTIGNANFRKQNDVVYVFDTEKASFAKNVHEKIDSFVQEHDAILSTLENR